MELLHSVTSTSVGSLPGLTVPDVMPLSATETLAESGAVWKGSVLGMGPVSGLTWQPPAGALVGAAGPACGVLFEHAATDMVAVTAIAISASLVIFIVRPSRFLLAIACVCCCCEPGSQTTANLLQDSQRILGRFLTDHWRPASTTGAGAVRLGRASSPLT